MFDKEQFVADYVEAVKMNDTEGTQEVLSRLSFDEGFDLRIELVNSILDELEADEGDFETHKEFLNKQITLLEEAKAEEENSASEDTKDESKVEEATQDVAADTGADNADENVEESATPVAESGGYAPATEEQAEKSEQ